MKYDVLIIDDEELLANSTCEYFNAFDVKTKAVYTFEETIDFLLYNQVDLILLDINLKNKSGFELCKMIRDKYDTPIFFISARLSNEDMMIALNIGGDDYITKPYHLNVLLAKVKARLKRNEQVKSITQIGNISIDYDKLKIYVNGKDCELKTKEFRLLTYMIANKNKVLTKEELFENVWDDAFFSDGTLNVHIRHIREKIEEDPNKPKYIKTVWGEGYIFEE